MQWMYCTQTAGNWEFFCRPHQLLGGIAHVEHLAYCRQLVRDGAPGTKILLGKRLLPVMAVRTVTANTAELQPIQDDLRKQEIEVWLPNGVALDTGDGCFTSPHLHFPPAIAQQTAQQTRPGSKSAQASMPMQIVRPGKQRCKVLRHPVITRTSLFAQRPLQMRLRWV